jgi:hypothetical protein
VQSKEWGRDDKGRAYNSYIISSGVALIFVNQRQTIECSAATSTLYFSKSFELYHRAEKEHLVYQQQNEFSCICTFCNLIFFLSTAFLGSS